MSDMTDNETHPAHGVVLEIGGAMHTVRSTFALSLAIEERYGSVFEIAQKALSREMSVTDLVDLLALMAPDAKRGDIEAHFDEVGVIGVITEVSTVFAQIMRGWREIGEEIGKASPLPGRRRGAGRPRGAKNKPKDASPGETSSAEPSASESVQPSSGELPLTSCAASGGQPGLLTEQAAPPAPAALTNGALSSPALNSTGTAQNLSQYSEASPATT